MSPISRRALLGSGIAAGAAAGLGVLGDALLAGGKHKGSLKDVEHVVVLTQENRSFDHYFGTLAGVRGFDDPAALRFPDGTSVFDQKDAQGRTITPWHLDTATTDAQEVRQLDHSWQRTHDAWNEGLYDAWIPAKTGDCMGFYRRADIPFHYALADAFTICDQYFCSVMGPTGPNRLYLWTGTVDPNGEHGGPVTSNFGIGYGWTTYPERLQAAGVTWKVYQQQDNYGDNALAWFLRYAIAAETNPLWINGMRKLGADDFADDVAAGKLPTVSWVIAPSEESEHPPYLPARGANFTATRVLQALAEHSDVWAKTVVFLNYDENDGYFDHVVPPTPPPGTADEFIKGKPIGLGPRVPMTVVSPWSRGGHVCSEVFDHTSVLRFLENVTGVREPNISAWRRSVCGDLTSAFDFTAKQIAFPQLPDTKALLDAAIAQHGKPAPEVPPTPSSMPFVETDERPIRPLGYAFETTSAVAGGQLKVTITNKGTLGGAFSAYTLKPGPFAARQYALPIGGSVSDSFPADDPYEVTIHGPDGFVRGFKGPGADPSEATLTRSGDTLHVTVSNAGPEDVTAAIRADTGGGAGDSQLRHVAAGASEKVTFTARPGDYLVTVVSGTGFERSFAGRLYPAS